MRQPWIGGNHDWTTPRKYTIFYSPEYGGTTPLPSLRNTLSGGSESAPSFNNQKGNMKIRALDVGLLAMGVLIGAVATVSLTSTPARVLAASVSTFAATGPVLAVASMPPQFVITTNIHLRSAPMRLEMHDSLDPQSPLDPPMQRSVDLIDMRHQLPIKPEDLK